VQYDTHGKPFTIYYHLLTPMLLNELQKAHRQTTALKSQVALLKSELASVKLAQRNENAGLKSEMASVKQSLAKLAAFVQASHQSDQVQPAVLTAP
jgi:hypothetical protein